VLFHPHLYHRTGGNRSDRHRRVLTLHFASATCRSLRAEQPDVYGFALVRGRTHPGCLQPAASPSIGFKSADTPV
jgi:ectoine hydroxylase-related dioxygenase (phytanoyl-CoA dioxygenase family)